MKRFALLTCVLAVATLASAQLYKYVDKNGKTVYTDQPPPESDSKAMKIPSSATGTPAPQKSAVQQDKELQKGRDKSKESEKKAEETAARAKADEENCAAAKMAYQTYASGGRISRVDEKGEKFFLGDLEIEAERDRAKARMDEACKKG